MPVEDADDRDHVEEVDKEEEVVERELVCTCACTCSVPPPLPPPQHQQQHLQQQQNHNQDQGISQPNQITSNGSGSSTRPQTFAQLDPNRIDDEHKLIARYAAKLAQDSHRTTKLRQQRDPGVLHSSGNYSHVVARSSAVTPPPSAAGLNSPMRNQLANHLINHHGSRSAAIKHHQEQVQDHREQIAKLEAKNHEIMTEIESLKQSAASNGAGGDNGGLLHELRGLRQRKDELEGRMMNLQDSRRELMGQLEALMRLLTPSRASTPAPAGSVGAPQHTPYHMDPGTPTGGGSTAPAGMRHLLHAADSVTTAMSSLVRELSQEEQHYHHQLPAMDPRLPHPAAGHQQGQAQLYRPSNEYTSYRSSYQQHQQQQHHRSNSLSGSYHHHQYYSRPSGHDSSGGSDQEGGAGGYSLSMYSDPECGPTRSTRSRQRGYSGGTTDEEEEAMFGHSWGPSSSQLQHPGPPHR